MKHVRSTSCVLLCLLGTALTNGTAAEKGAEGRLEPFLGEPKFQMQQISKGYGREPNGVVALDGAVLVTWRQPGGKSNVRTRRSEDGGKTWGEEFVIGEGWSGGGTTVDETTGDILAFVEDCHPPAPLTVYRSKDQGKTWKVQPTKINPDSNGNILSMCMNEAGITLRHGKHAGRLIRPARHYGKGCYPRKHWPTHYTSAIYSDDGGKTWNASKPFADMGTGEAGIVELSDGRLYYNSRCHWHKDKPPRKRRCAWSDDGGETWQDWQIIEILPDGPQNASYGCFGGLTRLPVRGRDILLYSNSDSPGRDSNVSEANSRNHGTVWVSFDGGRTWPLKRLVHEGPFCYSALSAGRPGTPSEGWIYLYFDVHAEKFRRPIRVARFNLSWLLQGEPTGDGELPAWIEEKTLDKGPASQNLRKKFAVWRGERDELEKRHQDFHQNQHGGKRREKVTVHGFTGISEGAGELVR